MWSISRPSPLMRVKQPPVQTV